MLSPYMSISEPIPKGNIAPPTIDMINHEEPGLVSSPIPSIHSAKMVGNIVDMKKPNPPSA